MALAEQHIRGLQHLADAGRPDPSLTGAKRGPLRVEPLSGPSLILEPLRVGHAEEMALLLNDRALHGFIGGSPEGLEELTKRYARQARGRSEDGSQQWLNWIVRRADTGQAVGTVQATITGAGRPARGELAWSSPARTSTAAMP